MGNSKTASCCFIFTCLYIIAIAITCLVFYSKAKENDDQYNKYFKDIQSNHKVQPLSSIQMQKTPCADKNQNVFNFQTPDIETYCDCGYRVYKGTCTKNKNHSQSSDYDRDWSNVFQVCWSRYGGIDPMEINNIKQVYFCGQKTNHNFLDLKTAKNANECEQGTKACGKDSEQYLCFPENEQCPINDIFLTETKRLDYQAAGYKESQIQINQGTLYLYQTNSKIDSPIPIDYQLGRKNICLDPEEEIVPVSQYILFERDYVSTCKSSEKDLKDDLRYEKMFDLNKLQLWEDNNVLQKYEKLSKFYTQSLDYEMGLFKRPYIHINTEGKALLQKHKELYSDLIIGSSFNFYALFITAIVFLSLLICCSCMCCCFGCIDSDKDKIPLQVIAILFLLLLIGVVLGITSFIYSKQKDKYDSLSILNEKKIGDKYTNAIVEESYSKNQNTQKKYFIMIILLSIAAFLGIVFICCIAPSGSKKHKKHKKNKKHKKPKKQKDFYHDHERHSKSSSSSSSSSSDSEDEHNNYQYQEQNYQGNNAYQPLDYNNQY